MRPNQIDLLTQLSAPSVHPDGSWAVVAATRASFEADAYTGQLWRIPLDGGPARRLTRGFRDTQPRFSPDGTLIAFLRAAPGQSAQLHVMPAAGGEPVAVTDAPKGVLAYAWSPDSRQLAYTARIPQPGRYGTLDGVGADAEDPRRIDRLQFHANGLGFTGDQRPQLFVVETPDPYAEPPIEPVGRLAAEGYAPVPSSRRLFEVDADLTEPTFSADGQAVLVLAATHESADSDLVSDLWRVPVDGSAPTRVTAGDRSVIGGLETADGLFVLATEPGATPTDFIGMNPGVFAVSGGELTRLTDLADHLGGGALAPVPGGVLAIEERRGLSRLQRVTTQSVEVLAEGVVITAAAAIPGRDAVLATVTTTTSPAELAIIEGGQWRAITDFGAGLRTTQIVEPQPLEATAPDGYPVHGWVLTPPTPGPHPTLLVIHGGPFAAYHQAYFDEWQVYAEAGYAVVSCNPRGSLGYGIDHGRSIKGAMGDRDFVDVMAFFEHALATVPGLDAERIGVMGGSYGGYMTAWIIAHDHRFRGAIVERGFLDPASFTGASDIGWFFQHEYNGPGRESMDAQSPLRLVDQVRTPTLVIHSEKDYRCPVTQGYQYFTELKLRGVETELLVFPGENHELSRSGTPWHRAQRFEAILAWWERIFA